MTLFVNMCSRKQFLTRQKERHSSKFWWKPSSEFRSREVQKTSKNIILIPLSYLFSPSRILPGTKHPAPASPGEYTCTGLLQKAKRGREGECVAVNQAINRPVTILKRAGYRFVNQVINQSKQRRGTRPLYHWDARSQLLRSLLAVLVSASYPGILWSAD